jgi:hypothetical protein
VKEEGGGRHKEEERQSNKPSKKRTLYVTTKAKKRTSLKDDNKDVEMVHVKIAEAELKATEVVKKDKEEEKLVKVNYTI